MNIQKLIHITKQPAESTQDDLIILENLTKKYPYSSFLHILAARVAEEQGSPRKKNLLTKAALYAPNRTYLRKVIEEREVFESVASPLPSSIMSDPKPSMEKPMSYAVPAPPQPVKLEEIKYVDDPVKEDEEKIYLQVLKNLEKLQKTRLQFNIGNLSTHEYQKPKAGGDAPAPTQENDEPETVKQAGDTPVDDAQEEKVAHEPEATPKPDAGPQQSEKAKAEGKPKKSQPAGKMPFAVENLEERPEKSFERTSTQQDATDIINSFMNASPQITPSKLEQQKDAVDLAEPSTVFSDSLVTENIAILLTKQQKYDKAVEMYKKLIWKFPQKKSYFASRIEELEKL